jgi:hypothetical protein
LLLDDEPGGGELFDELLVGGLVVERSGVVR